jgi:hypothetical protein
LITDLVQPLNMPRRCPMNLIRIYAIMKLGDFVPILRHVQPSQDHRLVNFQVNCKP